MVSVVTRSQVHLCLQQNNTHFPCKWQIHRSPNSSSFRNNIFIGRSRKTEVLSARLLFKAFTFLQYLNVVYFLPEGIRRERAVADADLITLLTGLEVRFSPDSPESNRCRARRTAKSLMAFGVVKSGPS